MSVARGYSLIFFIKINPKLVPKTSPEISIKFSYRVLIIKVLIIKLQKIGKYLKNA